MATLGIDPGILLLARPADVLEPFGGRQGLLSDVQTAVPGLGQPDSPQSHSDRHTAYGDHQSTPLRTAATTLTTATITAQLVHSIVRKASIVVQGSVRFIASGPVGSGSASRRQRRRCGRQRRQQWGIGTGAARSAYSAT